MLTHIAARSTASHGPTLLAAILHCLLLVGIRLSCLRCCLWLDGCLQLLLQHARGGGLPGAMVAQLERGALLVLKQLALQHAAPDLRCQHRLVAAIHSGLHRRHELGDLAPAEALHGARGVPQPGVIHAAHLDLLRAGLAATQRRLNLVRHRGGGPRPRLALLRPRLGNVLVQVQLQHLLALVRAWQPKLQRLVHAVQHGIIQVTRPVGGNDHHEIPGLVAGTEQQRVQSTAQALAHLVAAPPQERVRLVDEEQQAAARALRPVKRLVQLRDGLAAQGCHVTTAHDGVVQARGARQALGGHGLASARGAVEQHVAEGCAVALGVGGGGSQHAHVVVQALGQDDVAEVALDLVLVLGGGHTPGLGLPDGEARRLAHQAGGAQPALHRAAHHARRLARRVHAQEQRAEPAHRGQQLGAVRQQIHRRRAQVRHDRVDGLERLARLLLVLEQRGAPVDVLVVARLLDAPLRLGQRLLARNLLLQLRGVRLAGLALRLDLLLDAQPLRLLLGGRLLLQLDQLRVALALQLVLVHQPLARQLVLVLLHARRHLRTLLLQRALLLHAHLLALLVKERGLRMSLRLTLFTLLLLGDLLGLGQVDHLLRIWRLVNLTQGSSTTLQGLWIEQRTPCVILLFCECNARGHYTQP
mmetsp:Transcript_29150/g.74374  ORF Transcript_29150/g.74374 Transcript_29150/m.74374 type:complete len:643 (+) Transcript_29150:224-2152(+)